MTTRHFLIFTTSLTVCTLAANNAMMIPEVELQALRFFTRAELEGPQMHARHMRDVVNGHAKTLPLRHIHRVDVSLIFEMYAIAVLVE